MNLKVRVAVLRQVVGRGAAVLGVAVLRVGLRGVPVVADALLERRADVMLDVAVLLEEPDRPRLAVVQVLHLRRHLVEGLLLLRVEVPVLLVGGLVELQHLRVDALALLSERPNVVASHGHGVTSGCSV
jgi:hypothetical protein